MSTRFARPYAQALLKTASSDEQALAVRDDLRRFAAAMDEVPALARMAANPSVPLDAKRRVIDQLAGQLEISELGERFLVLLLEKYRLAALPVVLAAYERVVNQRLGIATARVTTAQPLDEAETERLRETLARLVERRVELELAVDRDLLAGFKARIGSTLYDASLRGQLDRLAGRLAEA